MGRLKIVYNKHCNISAAPISQNFSVQQAQQINRFHQSFAEYGITPLVGLNNTADFLGCGEIYVKDESFRFGLNAFKALGGSYCLGRYIAEKMGKNISDMEYADFVCAGEKDRVTFVTATDGNHGRGIAWAAAKLGHSAVVYMPKGSASERLENIRRLGAHAEITEVNYDDTVRFAKHQAEKNGWVLVQDTSWDGYEKIPAYIMQGYLTMAYEAVQQLGDKKPTHVFLQAGVGAMAGAVTAFLRSVYGADVKIIIVEPDKADCLYSTVLADDGEIHTVGGALDTIMAGLACGEPCTLAWNVLKYNADAFISMEDSVAARGMCILGNPAGRDTRIVSGESGAAGFAALAEIMNNQPEIKKQLNLNEKSVVLCFSTEGATDAENYRNIVWNGLYGEK